MVIAYYDKSRNVDTIVIGHNSAWKWEGNMGKRNNQNFVQIPFNILIHAGLNAIFRIIKKTIPEAFANWIEDIGLYPRSLSIR